MNGYFLEGLVTPDNTKSPLFLLGDQSNCCTQQDLIDLLEDYQVNVQPKLNSYQENVIQSLKKLKSLNTKVLSVQLNSTDIGEKQKQCLAAKNKLESFEFDQMIDKIKKSIIPMFQQFKKIHQSFYAVLCDLTAHDNISLSTRQVQVNSSFCLNILKNNKNYIYSLNVELLRFFKLAQEYLDCIVFDNAYGLKYPYQEKQQLRNYFETCYNNISSSKLSEECQTICSHLYLGRISPLFEGDPIFINEQVQYFEELIQKIKDSLKLKENEKEDFNPDAFLKQMNYIAKQYQDKKKELYSKLQFQGLFSEKLENQIQEEEKKDEDKKDDKKDDDDKKDKKDKKKKDKKDDKGDDKKDEKKDDKKPEDKKDDKKPDQKAQTKRQLQEGQPDDQSADNSPDKVPEKVLQYYNSLYKNIQDGMAFDQNSKEINKTWIYPLDISTYKMQQVQGKGIDLFNYIDTVNFDISKNDFVKLFKKAKKQVKITPQLQIILNELNEQFDEMLALGLNGDFTSKLPVEYTNPNEVKLNDTNTTMKLDDVENFIAFINPDKLYFKNQPPKPATEKSKEETKEAKANIV